jgi:hypothetical protein
MIAIAVANESSVVVVSGRLLCFACDWKLGVTLWTGLYAALPYSVCW